MDYVPFQRQALWGDDKTEHKFSNATRFQQKEDFLPFSQIILSLDFNNL